MFLFFENIIIFFHFCHALILVLFILEYEDLLILKIQE